MQKDISKIKKTECTLALGFCSVLSYTAHTRGIVVLIALLLTLLFMQAILKQNALSWTLLCITVFCLFAIDSRLGGILKNALYSISGLNANALETTDMKAYFSVFSYKTLKDLFMLCMSWLHTLIASAQGLVLTGIIVFIILLFNMFSKKNKSISDKEKVTAVFSFLVFAGYYAVGALFFKGTYFALRTKMLENRVDRLLYDRYAICGASMIVFLALYVLCCRQDLFRRREKIVCATASAGIFGLWFGKFCR